MNATPWKATLCLLAGAMDSATGACLLLAPGLALRLMGIAGPPEHSAYLRFIGAFVFAVGALYLVAWRLGRAGLNPEWRTLWLATAWLRLCVGSCVAVLILSGALPWQWVSVPVADLGLAAYQFGSASNRAPLMTAKLQASDPSPWIGPAIAATLVAGVFFYFLLFAQFALLQRIETADAAGSWLRPAMGLMGLGGVLGSLLAWRWCRAERLPQRLSALAGGCGLAALTAALSDSLWLLAFVAAAVGLFLGALTVSLVPTLSQLAPQRSLGLAIGLGVGFAYFFSNAPAVFGASASAQSALAAGVVALVALAPPLLPRRVWQGRTPSASPSATRLDVWLDGLGAWGIVATLFALVWLDSAAFYAIQRTDSLKAGAWNGEPRLWANAALHLAAAIVAGMALGRGRLVATLGAAMFCIAAGVACLKFGYGSDLGLGISAYVIGISLYSCALVAFGVMKGERTTQWSPAKRAAIAFAVAGWIGSGMGIGMAKDLQGVPSTFILGAFVFAISILASLKWRQSVLT